MGVVENKIEDGTLLEQPATRVLGALAGIARAEEPFENQARIRLGRHGSVGRAPGDIILVDARIIGVADGRLPRGVASEFEGRKPGEMTDLPGDGLIDGNSRVDVRRAFLESHAGEEDAVAARMVARAVRPADGIEMIEAAADLEEIAAGFERLQGLAKGKIRALLFGPPSRGDRAIREKHERGAQRRAGGGDGELACALGREQFDRVKRFKSGQGEHRAEAAQEIAAANTRHLRAVELVAHALVRFVRQRPLITACANLADSRRI